MKTLTALALATSVASCTTLPGNNTQAIITQIQNASILACGYLPDTSAIANLISVTVGGGTIIGQVEQIAQEICDVAVIPKSGKLRATKNVIVVVRGVSITGHFIR